MFIVIVGRSDLERDKRGVVAADATAGGCGSSHSVAAAPGLRELPDARTLPVKGGGLNYPPTGFV